MDIEDPQQELLEPLIPKPNVRVYCRGRPWRRGREVLN